MSFYRTHWKREEEGEELGYEEGFHENAFWALKNLKKKQKDHPSFELKQLKISKSAQNTIPRAQSDEHKKYYSPNEIYGHADNKLVTVTSWSWFFVKSFGSFLKCNIYRWVKEEEKVIIICFFRRCLFDVHIYIYTCGRAINDFCRRESRWMMSYSARDCPINLRL